MGWLALLWAAFLAPSGAIRDPGVLGPVTVLAPQDGPRVVFRPMAQPALVALRLTVPVEESQGYGGAARVLQDLARERLRAGAEQVGARLELEYTPGHAVYAIVGPQESFDAMAALLRRAVARPSSDRGAIEAAVARVEREALARLELPGARVRAGLEAELFATRTSESGALPDSVSPAGLQWFWRRHYVPERMTVVVVGAVPIEAVLPALRDWPSPPGPSGSEPDFAPSGHTAPPPEAVAPWAGLGWHAGEEDPAVLAVASTLLTRRLAESGLRQAAAELWWGLDRVGFVAVGSIPPMAASDAAPAQVLRIVLQETAELVTPQEVGDARRSIWHELLYDARTPGGLAALLGRFIERTGDPHAASRFLDALSSVDAAQVRAALLSLLHREPVVVEVGR